MPQVGERKTVGSVTGEWDGSTWIEVPGGAGAQSASPASTAAPQRSALSRFLGGAVGHSPLGGLYSAVTHPLDTIGGLVRSTLVDPITEGVEMGRSLMSGDKTMAAYHAEGMIPMIGKSLQGSSSKIAGGDVAGGLGELLGTASNAFVPEGVRATKAKAPGMMRGARTAARTAGSALETAGEHLSSPYVQGPAIAGTLMHGNVPGAALAIAGPKMLGATGRGLRRFAGDAGESPADPYLPNKSGYQKGAPAAEGLDPSIADLEDFSADPYLPNESGYSRLPPEMHPLDSPLQKSHEPHPALRALQERSLLEEAQQALEPPADFDWPEAGGSYRRNAEGSTLLDDADVPEFTYEGEANARYGEFPPGPAADMPSRPGRPQPSSLGELQQLDDPQAYSRTDNPLAPEGTAPLNFTKSGYVQRPGEARGHRRDWNDKQVTAARERALQAIRGLEMFQGTR